MALTTVSSDRLSTNVKTSNLGSELSKKIGQNKNIIINGAMLVAQRGTSTTTNASFCVDRFLCLYSGTDEAPTFAQVDVASGTTPYTNGFRKALKVTNGNQTSGAGTDDYIAVDNRIEAQDLASSGWNYTSSSSYITLSFWIKSSVAQKFYVTLKSSDGTQQGYAFETGSLTADTWTKITHSIPGNANLTFDNNNEQGLMIRLVAFRGTDKTSSGFTLNAWSNFNTNNRMPDNTSTWYTTNDATLEITGFQLEVGSVATDFEHRSFAEDLALCRRYCFAEPVGSTNDTYHPVMNGFCNSSSLFIGVMHLPVPMRILPSLTTSGNFQIAGSGVIADASSFTINDSDFGEIHTVQFRCTTASGTTGRGVNFRNNNDTSAKFILSAEL